MSWLQALPAIISAIATAGAGFLGKKGEQGSTFNKGQRSKIDEVLQSVGSPPDIQQNQGYQGGQEWLNSLFSDPDFFNNFEAPLQRDFQENTLPSIANRFGGMGSHGSFGGGFQRSLGRAGTDFQTNLAALRGGMQQQGVNQALQYGQQPVSNYMDLLRSVLQPTMNQYQPASAGPLAGPLSALTNMFAQGYANQAGQNAGGGAMNAPNSSHGLNQSNTGY
jgi:hypothetical protein